MTGRHSLTGALRLRLPAQGGSVEVQAADAYGAHAPGLYVCVEASGGRNVVVLEREELRQVRDVIDARLAELDAAAPGEVRS